MKGYIKMGTTRFPLAFAILALLTILVGGCTAINANLTDNLPAKLTIKDNPKTTIYGVEFEAAESELVVSGVVSLRRPGPAVRFSIDGHIDVNIVRQKNRLIYQQSVRLYPMLPWGKLSRPLYRNKHFEFRVPSNELVLLENDEVVLAYHEGQHDQRNG